MIELKYINLCLYFKKMMIIVLFAVLILVVVRGSWISCVVKSGSVPVKISEHSNKVVIQYSMLIHKGASTAFYRVA